MNSSALRILPFRVVDTTDRLTVRETEVLRLMAEGLSTREIGRILGVSFKTAGCHRGRTLGNPEQAHRTLEVRGAAAKLPPGTG